MAVSGLPENIFLTRLDARSATEIRSRLAPGRGRKGERDGKRMR